jgi:glycosyltransferase involved in cell wall biosynthesis
MNTYAAPTFTIIVPAYNEAESLASAKQSLQSALAQRHVSAEYELLICENGSRDATAAIAREMAQHDTRLRVEQLPQPSYGRALQHGIQMARGPKIIIVNVDFWDAVFVQTALELLEHYDFVVGSKNAPGAHDRRPWHRRAITMIFNALLRLLFGFRGTDTHGIKAMRAECAQKLAAACHTDAEVFDTELILRAQRQGYRLHEIPVTVDEQRPSRYGLWQRVPRTARDMMTLLRVLRH